MKKLFVIVAAVMVSTAVFAQDSKTIAPATSATPVAKVSRECYMMKDNALLRCTGTTTAAQTADVTLKNGTIITAKGAVTPKTGDAAQLTNGQCIDMTGKIGDCATICECKPEVKPADAK